MKSIHDIFDHVSMVSDAEMQILNPFKSYMYMVVVNAFKVSNYGLANQKHEKPQHQGPVIQNFVSLRPQLAKKMPTTHANTLLFFVDKI